MLARPSENRLDVAHDQVAAGTQRVEQRIHQGFLGSAIEIDDDVPARNQIERTGGWRLSQYVTSLESCYRANRREHCSSIAQPREELVQQLRCRVRERRRQIRCAVRSIEGRAIDVAAYHGHPAEATERARRTSVLIEERRK